MIAITEKNYFESVLLKMAKEDPNAAEAKLDEIKQSNPREAASLRARLTSYGIKLKQR